MGGCAVYGCNKNSVRDSQLKFYRVPKVIDKDKVPPKYKKIDNVEQLSRKRRDKYVRALKRNLTENQIDSARICSLHFFSGKPADLQDENHPDWVPNQNLGYKHCLASKIPKAISRFYRYNNRVNSVFQKMRQGHTVTLEYEEINDMTNEPFDHNVHHLNNNADKNVHISDSTDTDKGCQTDLSIKDLTESFAEALSLKREIKEVTFSEESFQNNNAKTKYFTGLTSSKQFFYLYNRFAKYLYVNQPKLPPFQQMLITLLKLRLNLPITYLAFRYNTSLQTISKYFRRCVHVLAHQLKDLIYWPEREEIWVSTPDCFKEAFGKKITVIVDCFEVFIERPSNLRSAAEVFSSYKHHPTGKVLVGISARSSIVFVSESWGGRASDKHVTEKSGILDKLVPGDVVLADRGFTVEESVNDRGAFLNIPAFTKGRDQLHPLELEETRQIANVRIHVERVIGPVRQKYTILSSSNISSELLRKTENGPYLFDEILIVCCALFNLCPPIVN